MFKLLGNLFQEFSFMNPFFQSLNVTDLIFATNYLLCKEYEKQIENEFYSMIAIALNCYAPKYPALIIYPTHRLANS